MKPTHDTPIKDWTKPLRLARYLQYFLAGIMWSCVLLQWFFDGVFGIVAFDVALGLALFQLGYGFFVGIRLKSPWHLKMAKFSLGYVLFMGVLSLLMGMMDYSALQMALLVCALLLLLAGVVFITWYAFRQAHFLPQEQVGTMHSDDTLLDDWPIS